MKKYDPEIKNSMLMNFLTIVQEALKIRDFILYKHLIAVYSKAIERDEKFIEYLDRIGKIYFEGQTIRAPNQM